MKARLLLIPAALGLVLPLASPAAAAPACAVFNWRDGDACTFEAPATAVRFGGKASAIPGARAWIAVQVLAPNSTVPIDSCYAASAAPGLPAACAEDAMPLAPGVTYVCRVEGTGGLKFHCADPPPLPIGQ